MKLNISSARSLVLSTFLVAVLTACNVPVDPGSVGTGTGSGSGDGGTGTVNPGPTATPTSTPTGLPTGTPTGTPTPIPTTTPSPQPSRTPTAETCVSTDSSHICIGLKLVSYIDNSTNQPTVNEAAAKVLVNQINQVWSVCDIAFQLENYQGVDPTRYGLDYGSASENQLTSIRNRFSDDTTMLVVVTGPWTGRTIAWTTMPGGGPFGTIVEADYGHNPYTVGHELGHYQGLYHISDSSNLMNPYIGTNTSALTSSQCRIAQQTDTAEWQSMLRHY